MAAGETACRSFWVKNSSLNAPRHKVLNGTNKFRTAYDVGCRIAAIMSRNGTSVYLKMLEALRSFEDAVKDGDVPEFTQASCLSSACYGGALIYSDSKPPTVRVEDQAPTEEVLVDSGNCVEVDEDKCHFVEPENVNRHHEEVAQNVTRHTEGVTNDERHSDDGTVDKIHSVEVAGLKRHSEEVESEAAPVLPAKRSSPDDFRSSSFGKEPSFFAVKSTKSRGRPAVRKTQKREEKKRQMAASGKEAKQLVQGALLPDATLGVVGKVLKFSYSYESAYQFYLDYQKILTNADVAIGIRVHKVDTFTKHQFEVMTEYHEVMKQLLDVVETIEWVQTTSLNSLDIPRGLDEYANLEKAIATTAMQRLVFPMSRISPFEEITNEAYWFFGKICG
ncbi:hypothetical protein PI124_g13087 [Phytophthora idaei]|nr:hypothetical protein PI124_g13087 [Phytophthora idaei]